MIRIEAFDMLMLLGRRMRSHSHSETNISLFISNKNKVLLRYIWRLLIPVSFLHFHKIHLDDIFIYKLIPSFFRPQHLLDCEFYLLEMMDCSLIVHLPYRPLTLYCESIGPEVSMPVRSFTLSHMS